MFKFCLKCVIEIIGVVIWWIPIIIILNFGGIILESISDFFCNIPALSATTGSIIIAITIFLSLRNTIKKGIIAIQVLYNMYIKYKLELDLLLVSTEAQKDKHAVLQSIDDFTESLSGLLSSLKAPKKYTEYLRNIIKKSDYTRC